MTGVSVVSSCLGTISIKKIASIEVDAAEHPLPPKLPTPIASVTWLLRRSRKSVFLTASFYTKLRISVINGDIKRYLLGKQNQKYSRHESTMHSARTHATEVAGKFEIKWK